MGQWQVGHHPLEVMDLPHEVVEEYGLPVAEGKHLEEYRMAVLAEVVENLGVVRGLLPIFVVSPSNTPVVGG